MKDPAEMKSIQKVILWNAIIFLFLAGCSSRPKGVPSSPAHPPSSIPITEPRGTTDEEIRLRRLAEQMREAFRPVYFGHDQANLDSNARGQLANTGAFMKEHPEVSVAIEGYCDEQGTEEYNLALGEKRAATVAKYLLDYGISGDRLKPISFGEENPAQEEHGETAWKLNRRVEFRVSQQ